MKAVLMLTLLLCCVVCRAQPDLVLRYNQPATTWTEALPVGNGRLGAMVFGNIGQELTQLNDATLWSGGPVHQDVNPAAFEHLATARAALVAGDYASARNEVKKMQGRYTESYLPLGDVSIAQRLPDVQPSEYSRELDLRDAVTTTKYTVNGVRYTRKVFASAPDGVIVVNLTADKPSQLSLTIDSRSALHFEQVVDGNMLITRGRAPTHVEPNYVPGKNQIVYDTNNDCDGMRYEFLIAPRVTGGHTAIVDNLINITQATEIELLISAATSYNGFDQCPFKQGRDEHQAALTQLMSAKRFSYRHLLQRHLSDYQHYFDRVSLQLNVGEDRSLRPTDERLADYSHGAIDASLEALYFQFGRYLLISSSRTRNAPANLQGIWNKEIQPPWSSNYTTNINLQMNYWPVEAANLTEMMAPLDDLIRHIAVTGHETAWSFYHAPGWVLHHNSDIWAASNPVGNLGGGDPLWANWYMGGNWVCRHLWEHYLFTQDKAYLRSAYPIMKGAAEFTLSWLQENGDGKLVTIPSTSPENSFYYGEHQQASVSIASTMDMSIIRDLVGNVIAASEALDQDAEFRQTLRSTQARLLPLQIGSQGQLQEWYQDFAEVDPHHRHVSHLYGLHPAQEISPLTTPELAAAARRTLELRGDDGTGWSLAWKINMWARLLDGDHAYRLLRNLLRLTKDGSTEYGHHGGAYPNLFDAHPPFQIDGNFAGMAGMIEMLLQSQNNEIHLLPALPDAWQSGKIAGLVARGNYIVDMEWQNHLLRTARVVARTGGLCTIRTNAPIRIPALKMHSERGTAGYVLTFTATKGTTYLIETEPQVN